MRTRLVAGNWKMHGSLAENDALLARLKGSIRPTPGAVFAVCVPYPYLEQARQSLTGSALVWGTQNVSKHDKGAYTGEVSVTMLKDFECSYVIVGHSERRQYQQESDLEVAEKFMAASRGGLTPILCVGETLAEREGDQTESVVARQLNAVIELAGVEAVAGAVVAYEPVWAIGTGRTATPTQAQEVHAFIRQLVAEHDPRGAERLSLLYGGSVKASNAIELFGMPDIDGGLIGGASLIAEEFIAVCEAVKR